MVRWLLLLEVQMPSLGWGMAEKARKLIKDRKSETDKRIEEITSSSTTPNKQVRVQEGKDTRVKAE